MTFPCCGDFSGTISKSVFSITVASDVFMKTFKTCRPVEPVDFSTLLPPLNFFTCIKLLKTSLLIKYDKKNPHYLSKPWLIIIYVNEGLRLCLSNLDRVLAGLLGLYVVLHLLGTLIWGIRPFILVALSGTLNSCTFYVKFNLCRRHWTVKPDHSTMFQVRCVILLHRSRMPDVSMSKIVRERNEELTKEMMIKNMLMGQK